MAFNDTSIELVFELNFGKVVSKVLYTDSKKKLYI